jgi:hypothetical protein
MGTIGYENHLAPSAVSRAVESAPNAAGAAAFYGVRASVSLAEPVPRYSDALKKKRKLFSELSTT